MNKKKMNKKTEDPQALTTWTKNVQDRGIMVYTKKTLSSQNSSKVHFSLYNQTLFLTQIKYSHDAK